MKAVRRRVFREYRRRYLPRMVALIVIGQALVMSTFGHLGAGLALLLVLAWIGLLADRVILTGNGWLRGNVRDKLRAAGDVVDHPADMFVGLAHPLYNRALKRVVETDDDVGFLEFTDAGLRYRGDALEFEVPAERIESVRMVRTLAAPWRRVEVRIADGEPFDQLIFDARCHGSHFRCRLENGTLLARLRSLMRPGAAGRERLLAADEIDLPLPVNL